MKRVICFVAMCAMSSAFAMHSSNDMRVETADIVKEKEELLGQLFHKKRVMRTKALETLERRCCRDVPWAEVKNKIVGHLLYIDLFADLAYHPAIMKLMQRAVEFRLVDSSRLVKFKQDLFCIDHSALLATPEGQYAHSTMEICNEECSGATHTIRAIVRELEFLPQGFEPEDSN